MASSEKFCLRWNDFESNISGSLRELREEIEALKAGGAVAAPAGDPAGAATGGPAAAVGGGSGVNE